MFRNGACRVEGAPRVSREAVEANRTAVVEAQRVNRATLERHPRANGCAVHHHGGRHDGWINVATLARAPIPRHRVIKRERSGQSAELWEFPFRRANSEAST